jgi:phosphatidylserine decarboxylase
VFNCHSNRSPVDAKLRQSGTTPENFVNAGPRQGIARERAQCPAPAHGSGADVVCVQVAGLIARRILCYVKAGERLARGQRFGDSSRFGSRVDVYLPAGATPKVAVGDKVYATETLLAMLPQDR